MTTVGTDLPAQRAPGRPRDIRCDQAIIGATLEILAAGGMAGLSMEAVAARAGVGKATIYRRWSSKESLVVDALATLAEEGAPAHTGSLRDDLVTWLDNCRRTSWHTLAGRIMPKLLAERDDHPRVLELYCQRVITPRREVVAEVLRGGIASGELPDDVDVDFVTDMLLGPVAYRQLVRRATVVTREQVVLLVDTVLAGIRRR